MNLFEKYKDHILQTFRSYTKMSDYELLERRDKAMQFMADFVDKNGQDLDVFELAYGKYQFMEMLLIKRGCHFDT